MFEWTAEAVHFLWIFWEGMASAPAEAIRRADVRQAEQIVGAGVIVPG